MAHSNVDMDETYEDVLRECGLEYSDLIEPSFASDSGTAYAQHYPVGEHENYGTGYNDYDEIEQYGTELQLGYDSLTVPYSLD